MKRLLVVFALISSLCSSCVTGLGFESWDPDSGIWSADTAEAIVDEVSYDLMLAIGFVAGVALTTMMLL